LPIVFALNGRGRRGRTAHAPLPDATSNLELGERLAVGYHFHIAASCGQAICEAAPHYEEDMKMFGELQSTRQPW
jgi:hypothetical protein